MGRANPELLARRCRILRELRRFFDERDFIEVVTPVRIAAPAPEEHIDCPVVPSPDGSAPATYLRASPEIEMKKLLAAGMPRIYQLGPCFREGERGSRHNPEFTMLEWYRLSADYLDILRDTEELFRALAGEPKLAFRRLTVREAYREFADWDPWTDWNQDRFDFDMATKVEPALKALGGGVFLMDYPVAAASLAKVRDDVAERWEFYYDGLELANCFTELCDGEEQRRRFERARANRRELGETDYPLDESFFDCLPLIGSASGVALGIDRLVMVLTHQTDISSVMA